MSEKEDAAYEAWRKEYESTLNDEEKAAFTKLMSSEKGREPFRANLRDKDYYTRLNKLSEAQKEAEASLNMAKAQLDADSEKLWGWFEQQKPVADKLTREKMNLEAQLAAARSQLSSLGILEDSPTPKPNGSGDTTMNEVSDLKKELDGLKRKISSYDSGFPRMLADVTSMTRRLVKEGYEIDPAKVVLHSFQKGVDFNRALEDLTFEERQQRADADLEAKIKAARDEGKREALSTLPTPDRVRPSAPRTSILDSLTSAPKTREERLRRAVERHDELAAAVQ